MAINIAQDAAPDTPVRIIAKIDDAIDEAASDWDAYAEALDEAHLKFLPGKAPTIFLCNFKLDAKAARMVNNAMMAGKDDEGKPNLAYGAWSQTAVKVTLKDVQNPDYVPADQRVVMRKDANGYVHEDLLAKLERWGVTGDIFNAYLKHLKASKGPETLKNS